jgi:hypothetical protein
MKKAFVTGLSLLYPALIFSQILNLDRTVEVDTSNNHHKKYAAILGASFNSVQQTVSFVNGAVNYDFTHFMPKNHILVLSGRADITTSGNQTLNNIGYAHLRYRDNDTRILSAEPFLQYQWNYTLGLLQRSLAGCNLRVQVYNREKADIYYGVGLMYESELWNYNGVPYDNYYYHYDSTVKNNNVKTNEYIKASITVSPSCDIVTAIFLQNKIDDFTNTYRLSDYTSINLRISRKLFFSVSGDIAYDNNPVVPIHNINYTLYSSLSIRL